ncbi:MAG: hypothetical protein H6R27_353 [Proteobacteria bacterium]|nr:hypothetical protein [Pseudomonadota bacterium]
MAWKAILEHLVLVVAAVASFATVTPAVGVPVGNLYEVSVDVPAGGDAAAFRAGIGDVLVKVTGRRDAAGLPGLAALVNDAGRYVTSYRRAPGGRLAIAYDADAIESAVAAAGLPFWGEDRPLTLVWLAVDRGGGQRGLITAEAPGAEKRAVEAAAGQRGLPLAWPSSAGGEDPKRRFEQAWSGDPASLAETASRYGADGILVGRARPTGGGQYTVDWTFIGAGGRSEARGNLAEGVHHAADRYASRYASREAAHLIAVDVTVTGIATAAQYAEATRLLAGLSVVKEVTLRAVTQDAVVFHVSTRGGLASLQREAAAGGRLRPVAGEQGSAVFAYQP